MKFRYSNLSGGGNDDHDPGVDNVWRDVPFGMVGMLIFFFVLMLALVSDPKDEKDEGSVEIPANILIEAAWDADRDVDLDLWVLAPGDDPVGYSSTQGKVFNLVRDDLGKRNDPLPINMENMFSRGIPAGEYTVNIHYYNDHDGRGPLECTVNIRVRNQPNGRSKTILSRKVTMRAPGHEVTVFTFRLNEEGELIEGSVNELFKPVRSRATRWR